MVFEHLSSLFVEVFGEAAVYTSAGGEPTILDPSTGKGVIFVERAAIIGQEPGSDDQIVEAHFNLADLGSLAPTEGATLFRNKTGETFKIVPPIQADGKGMISCMLARM